MSALEAPEPTPAGFTEDEFYDLARRWLAGRGWQVRPADGSIEITPGELAKMVGLTPSGLGKRLKHPHCPPFRAWRGPKGRIWRIVLCPALSAWVSAPKRPGKRSSGPLLPLS